MQFSISVLTAILSALSVSSLEILAPNQKRDVSVPDYVSNFKGITYTPFNENYECRSENQIKTDLAPLKDFDILRLYSADCNVIQYAAETINGKLIVAVNDISSADAIKADITTITNQLSAAGTSLNDKVDTVTVGNELIYNDWYTVDQVGEFISQAKTALSGFTGSVITVETVSSFYGNPSLCGIVDYIGTNSHPFFDNSDAEGAGDYVLSHIQAVAAFCKEKGYNKESKVLESGWPWKGSNDGVAVPSSDNQVTAVKSISEKAGGDVILFSAYNELWKSDSNWAVEKNWGMLGNAPSAW